MTGATLGYKDGWLCAVEVTNRWTEPVQDTAYWPFFRDSRTRWEADLGKPLDQHSLYAYTLRGGRRQFQLWEAGKTKAVAVESQAIPKPPRLRSEVRWHAGWWQKYDRKKGWVRA